MINDSVAHLKQIYLQFMYSYTVLVLILSLHPIQTTLDHPLLHSCRWFLHILVGIQPWVFKKKKQIYNYCPSRTLERCPQAPIGNTEPHLNNFNPSCPLVWGRWWNVKCTIGFTFNITWSQMKNQNISHFSPDILFSIMFVYNLCSRKRYFTNLYQA